MPGVVHASELFDLIEVSSLAARYHLLATRNLDVLINLPLVALNFLLPVHALSAVLAMLSSHLLLLLLVGLWVQRALYGKHLAAPCDGMAVVKAATLITTALCRGTS